MSGHVRGRLVLFTLAALVALALLAPGEPLPSPPPAPVAAAFDGERAYALVGEIVRQFPRRTTGSPADGAAAAWMAERFAALGLEVLEQSFDTWGARGRTRLERHAGSNVLAVSRGADPRAIVIGAHRDVVPETIEGAEDNASGTAALVELARVLAGAPHRLSYVFVSFGAEETGLGGSRHYLAHAPLATALAISVDTVGQADGRRVFLADRWSLPVAAAWELNAQARAAGLVDSLPERGLLSLTRLAPPLDAGVTDSLPFALRGLPAVGVGWIEPPYPQAHTPADTLARLSPASLARAGGLVERFVRAVDANPALLAPGDYLLSADGHYVGPGRLRATAVLFVVLALGQVALAAAQTWPPRGCWRHRGPLVVATFVSASLGGLPVLAHPADDAPRPWTLLLWTGWWTLCVALPSVPRRSAPAASLAERRLEVVLACAASFLGISLLVNPYFAVLAAGYPLGVLSWLPLGHSRRARLLGWLLFAPWAVLVWAALLLVGASSVFVPEIVPPAEAAIASSLLLWPLAAALAVLRDRRPAGHLASRAAFR